MLKSNLCFSNSKARKMQDRKKEIKLIKASFKDAVYLFIFLLIAVNIFNRIEIKIQPKGIAEAQTIEVPVIKEVITKAPDERVYKLKTFLESKHSPLAPYSELIVAEADKYDIGYTKIASISGMESAFGLRLPKNSYNAWGLGGSKFMYFDSWEDSIKYVSRLIGTAYKTNELSGIKAKYCPASDNCNPQWVFVVAKASTDILGIE